MASVADAKRCAENESYSYKAQKELEKWTPYKDVGSLFGVSINTLCLSTWKNNKAKIVAMYNSGLILKRAKPEKYEQLNKAVHKWFFVMRSDNVPISGPILKEMAIESTGDLDIVVFQASEWWDKNWKMEQNQEYSFIYQ